MLHQEILDYIPNASLDELTGELYGRLKILSRMQPKIMRHVVELRRMTQFANAPDPESPLPPLADVWAELKKTYVRPVEQPKVKRPRERRTLTTEERRRAQEQQDHALAIQLAKQSGCYSSIESGRTFTKRVRRSRELSQS